MGLPKGVWVKGSQKFVATNLALLNFFMYSDMLLTR